MAAYVVARLEVRNLAWREEYSPKTRALVRRHGGKILASFGSTVESLEGDAKPPDTKVLLEFPSAERAKAWYNDPEYAPMIRLRQTGAEADLILVNPA